MANTFSKIYIHIVFAVKNRNALIMLEWETHLYKYITGIVQKKGQIMLAINGMPDHIHILIAMKPVCSLSDLVREIKKASSVYIKEQNFCPTKFEWQGGYGAFSYAESEVNTVIRYIMNQKEHHRKVRFKREYIRLLKDLEVEYRKEYLFDWLYE